jgi:hypothetical protein
MQKPKLPPSYKATINLTIINTLPVDFVVGHGGIGLVACN